MSGYNLTFNIIISTVKYLRPGVSQLKTMSRAETFERWLWGQLEVKCEEDIMPSADSVPVVVEVYDAVCQLYSRRWNKILST